MSKKIKGLSKNALYVVAVVIFISIFLITSFSGNHKVSDIKEVSIAGKNIKVEVAASQSSQEQGLSGHIRLKDDEGMLFAFDHSAKYYFWMKEMTFPIDIIWISQDKKVIYIKQNATPKDGLKTFGPDTDSMYVLEVNSGFSDKNNLQIGDKIKFIY
ncbi:MAG: DUF192 domain-containing protein [Candidatus Pacebacteria bacterium]|jgi:uncharacterized membrane protein (UPF0127 family)|nr:DUF192 domain-containing protein [Candidatus Paceibacterota bacterium]